MLHQREPLLAHKSEVTVRRLGKVLLVAIAAWQGQFGALLLVLADQRLLRRDAAVGGQGHAAQGTSVLVPPTGAHAVKATQTILLGLAGMHDQLEFVGADITGAGPRITDRGLGIAVAQQVGDLGGSPVKAQPGVEFAVLYIVVQHPHALGALATQHVLRRVDKGRLGTIVIALTDLLGEYQQVFALAVIPGISRDLLAAHFHPVRHLVQWGQRDALISPHAGDTGHRHQQSHQRWPQLAA